jgi:hypothetical protein
MQFYNLIAIVSMVTVAMAAPSTPALVVARTEGVTQQQCNQSQGSLQCCTTSSNSVPGPITGLNLLNNLLPTIQATCKRILCRLQETPSVYSTPTNPLKPRYSSRLGTERGLVQSEANVLWRKQPVTSYCSLFPSFGLISITDTVQQGSVNVITLNGVLQCNSIL